MNAPRRRRSLLEDDDFAFVVERESASSGALCERCSCTRSKHDDDDGCACGRCEGFVEVGEEP
jgi:hypothetical protein